MGHKFAERAFTDAVRQVQQAEGSRANYAAMEEGDDYNYLLGDVEANFIAERDSFYMSSVSETGWPYLQHRGGPAGFLRVLDEKTLGFADFSGNRQYVSTGNFLNNDRVALFFMDYPNRRRLKLLGRVRQVSTDETELLSRLEVTDYRARVERGFVISVEAFDWNCPQHITPRYTESHIEELLAPLVEKKPGAEREPEKIRCPRYLATVRWNSSLQEFVNSHQGFAAMSCVMPAAPNYLNLKRVHISGYRYKWITARSH